MKYLMILSLIFISPAWAEENTPQKETLISLSATSSINLPNDEAVVNYRMEATGMYADALRKKVNRMSRLIHQQLKGAKGIKQTTLSRRMEMRWRYDKLNSRQVRDGWRLVQTEQLVSSSLDAIPDWVDRLEKAGAHLNQLSFRISDATLKATQNSLRLQAIQSFRHKANSLTKALDATSFRIIQLQTSQQRPVYRMRQEMPAMAMMSKSESSPPQLNAGEGKISVTVSGSIALPFKAYTVK
ncbi:MAG: SIMPL domain-containing protein [Mariprofundaceae bacterium]|nr:SIMPL domain-containing protein [Mariprofundaceae bacterium]